MQQKSKFKAKLQKVLENLPTAVGAFLIFFIAIVVWPYLSVWLAIFEKEDKNNPVDSAILHIARISVLSNFFYFVMESLRPYFRVILINLGG